MDGRGLARYLRGDYREAKKKKEDKDKDKENNNNNKSLQEKLSNKDEDKDKDVDQTAHSQIHTSQSNLTTAPRKTSQSNLTAPRPPGQVSSQELLAKALARLQASICYSPSSYTSPTPSIEPT